MVMPGAILAYHGIMHEVPGDLSSRFHNVTPTAFEQQVVLLKANFDVVSVDDWIARTDRANTFALTFDDGYRDTVKGAGAVLVRQQVPGTFFLNGALLRGDIFWRDRIRSLMGAGLVHDFLAWLPAGEPSVAGLTASGFYHQSKTPKVHSGVMDAALRCFAAERGLPQPTRHTADVTELVDHCLISYGNHTFSHHLLASLGKDEIAVEIRSGRRSIESLPLMHAHRSHVLAFPFGGVDDVDGAALEATVEADHSAAVFATSERSKLPESRPGLTLADRIVAPPSARALAALLVYRLRRGGGTIGP